MCKIYDEFFKEMNSGSSSKSEYITYMEMWNELLISLDNPQSNKDYTQMLKDYINAHK